MSNPRPTVRFAVERRSGEPIAAGEWRVRLHSRVVRFEVKPFGGFVWNMPAAVSARRAGDPVTQGDTIGIPAAEVLSAMGMGIGSGVGRAPAPEGAEPTAQSEGSGFGGGGGGRVLARPVAAIVIRPNGVIVQPIVDVTKIGLAALTAAGFMIGTLLTMSNRRRAMRAIKGE